MGCWQATPPPQHTREPPPRSGLAPHTTQGKAPGERRAHLLDAVQLLGVAHFLPAGLAEPKHCSRRAGGRAHMPGAVSHRSAPAWGLPGSCRPAAGRGLQRSRAVGLPHGHPGSPSTNHPPSELTRAWLMRRPSSVKCSTTCGGRRRRRARVGLLGAGRPAQRMQRAGCGRSWAQGLTQSRAGSPT